MYTIKHLLDDINMGTLKNDPEVKSALEGLDMNDLWDNLVKKTNEFQAWIEEEPCNGYHFMGMESAYIKDRNIFKGAWIRFKMAFTLNLDRSMVEYVSVLRDVDTFKIDPGGSHNVLLNKDNIMAFDELMNLMGSMNTSVFSKEAIDILKKTNDGIDSYTRKLLITMLVMYVPFINIIAVILLISKERKVNAEVQDIHASHSDLLKKSLSDLIKKSKLGDGMDLKYENDGTLTIDSISKISSKINKLKMKMLPVAARGTSIPRWFKSKQYISYEDKREVVELVKKNIDNYLGALGGSPTGMSNSLKLIMSAEKLQQLFDYGASYDNSMTIENAYASLATTMFLAFTDVVTTSMILTQDLKKY